MLFLVALLLIAVWIASGQVFHYSDTWQLVINTGTTIVTFLMVFLIQNTQNRDSIAVQLKLSELVLAAKGAENRFATIEDLTDEELEKLHEDCRSRAELTLDHLRRRRSRRGLAGEASPAHNHAPHTLAGTHFPTRAPALTVPYPEPSPRQTVIRPDGRQHTPAVRVPRQRVGPRPARRKFCCKDDVVRGVMRAEALVPTLTLARMAAGIILVVLNMGPLRADGARTFSGLASHYGKNYSGVTAAGETYDPDKFTAAHRTLPFGTRLRVTDPKTRRSVTVVVNDRGPFIEGRVLDLSMAAARELDMVERGVAPVTVTMGR